MASIRNWRRWVRLNVQFFESDRSVWLRPGWRHSARTELPYVPSAAGAYALGLNQYRFAVWSPAPGSPTMFGRPPRRNPLVFSEMRDTGWPELIEVSPAICQPASTALSSVFDEVFRKGISYT